MQERIESLSHPGAKETEKAHAGMGARWTARSPADLARNDHQAPPALCDIIVNWHARDRHKDEQLGQEVFETLTLRCTFVRRVQQGTPVNRR